MSRYIVYVFVVRESAYVWNSPKSKTGQKRGNNEEGESVRAKNCKPHINFFELNEKDGSREVEERVRASELFLTYSASLKVYQVQTQILDK